MCHPGGRDWLTALPGVFGFAFDRLARVSVIPLGSSGPGFGGVAASSGGYRGGRLGDEFAEVGFGYFFFGVGHLDEGVVDGFEAFFGEVEADFGEAVF